MADYLKDGTSLLHSVKTTAREIGLYINADKTEFIFLNQDTSDRMKSLNGKKISQVDDFKYLGSYTASTEHDIDIRLKKLGSIKWNECDLEIQPTR